jgi:predicted dithiol-disulfide oxidoreductase (DUF899 family)
MAATPPVVSAEEWQVARDELLRAEKENTHARDALSARRRRLPMVQFPEYKFDSPTGPRTLLDLFGDNDQLAVYQFMNVGPDGFCPGCTHFTNNISMIDVLAENGCSWATISDMPQTQIEGYKKKMGWTLPFLSSAGTSFAKDCGADEGFMLTVFLRDGSDVYRTYNTTGRGVDGFLFVNSILDLCPYGRQEDWEDSPPGWPQHPTYG